MGVIIRQRGQFRHRAMPTCAVALAVAFAVLLQTAQAYPAELECDRSITEGSPIMQAPVQACPPWAGWYRTMASDATSHSRANDFCPLQMTVCKCAHDALAHAGSADPHECPCTVLASPLRDLQETFCARYALDHALPLPHSSDTHQRACLHALHAHKLPECFGCSQCLSSTMRRGAPSCPSRPR